MKTYHATGWTDRGTYETMDIVARSMAEAIQIANENGLYPSQLAEN